MSSILEQTVQEPKIVVIDLAKHNKYPVFCEDEGVRLRKLIDEKNPEGKPLDEQDVIINVVISDEIWALNSHFLCNFFSPSFNKLNREEFNNKFKFTKVPISNLSEINITEPPCEFMMKHLNDFFDFAYSNRKYPFQIIGDSNELTVCDNNDENGRVSSPIDPSKKHTVVVIGRPRPTFNPEMMAAISKAITAHMDTLPVDLTILNPAEDIICLPVLDRAVIGDIDKAITSRMGSRSIDLSAMDLAEAFTNMPMPSDVKKGHTRQFTDEKSQRDKRRQPHEDAKRIQENIKLRNTKMRGRR